ncbi:MAG: glycosyltransferase family 2 protein [Anaerolineae bacterium]
MSVDFSVIVVSWNTRELLRQCLQSIVDEPGIEIVAAGAQSSGAARLAAEMIVVDNASDDGSGQMVQADFPQARLIANRHNAGFAAANNQAIAQARGRVLLLLNPDAYLLPGALAGLARFLRDHPEAAAAGPNVLNPDGSWQAAAFRFATLWDLFCEALFLSVLWPRSPLFARKELGGFDRDAVREVDWVQGCALAVRRDVWDAVGPFDEGYWMYVEELDWCRRAKNMGYRIFFTPDAQVVHYGKRSVAKARASVLPLGFRSHFRYYRKFDGRAKELAVRSIALLQMGLRAGISAGMILATRGVAQARWQENWRAYTGVIREALAVWS